MFGLLLHVVISGSKTACPFSIINKYKADFFLNFKINNNSK